MSPAEAGASHRPPWASSSRQSGGGSGVLPGFGVVCRYAHLPMRAVHQRWHWAVPSGLHVALTGLTTAGTPCSWLAAGKALAPRGSLAPLQERVQQNRMQQGAPNREAKGVLSQSKHRTAGRPSPWLARSSKPSLASCCHSGKTRLVGSGALASLGNKLNGSSDVEGDFVIRRHIVV